MSRRPRLSGSELAAALAKCGFAVVRIRGSHQFLQHEDGRTTVVPVHSRAIIGPGLFNKILRDYQLSVDDFRKLLK